MDRYGFKRSDIIRVIHLIDTDGAFIPNANVVAGDVEKLQYEENRIVAKVVSQTIARNERKQRVLHRLYPAKKSAAASITSITFQGIWSMFCTTTAAVSLMSKR